jgi:NDP-sugar pyrophosphorylase family protein
MKVLVLAAGEGVRLGRLTEEIPKVMLRVDGIPVLEHTIRRLEKQGFREVTINLHHLPEVIRGHFGDGQSFGVRITYSYEPEPLGTAGAARKLLPQLGSDPFLVVYGDNLTDCDFGELVRFHEERSGEATIGVHRREDVTSSGAVLFDEKGRRIEKIIEKPSEAEASRLGNWVSAGVLVIGKRIADLIPSGFSDFGRDIFPVAIERGIPVYAYKIENVIWIDTPEAYAAAQGLRKEGETA